MDGKIKIDIENEYIYIYIYVGTIIDKYIHRNK